MPALRKKLVARLAKLGVEDRPLPGRDDGFSSLFYAGTEFAHFHDDHELDLRLGKQTIREEGLVHPSDSRVHPKRSAGSPWIELRFEKAADLDRIVRLVKRAVLQIEAG